jgi:hypothetical protein
VITPAQPAFTEKQSTFSASAYFDQGEVLAQIGVPDVDQVSFSFGRTPEAFLRIIPTEPRGRPIPFSSLNEVTGSAELLRSSGFGGLTFVNKHGAILYAPTGAHRGGPAPMRWATQLFPNGELWSVSDAIMVREREWRPAWWPLPLIPATVFEQAFYRALHKNVAVAVEQLGLVLPCTIELGLVCLSGAYLAISQDDIRGPIQPNDAIVRRELTNGDPATINAVLLEFFTEVYDKTGFARPAGLHGFPPGPPSA